MLNSQVIKAGLAILVCAVAAIAVPAAAVANSALDQYVEEVPNTQGHSDPRPDDPAKGQGQGSQGTGNGQKVSASSVEQLTADGDDDGSVLVALAESTGPPSGSGGNPSQAGSSAATAAQTNQGLNDSIGSVAASSGVSLLLFVLVAVAAAAMGVLAWSRRSGGRSS